MFSQVKVWPARAWRPSISTWMSRPGAPETLPAAAIVAIAAASLLWNAWVGIRWQPDLTDYFAISAITMLIACCCARIRPDSPVREIAFYLALWMLFPIFTTRLTYLCVTIGYELADPVLLQADTALGFNWLQWEQFAQSHALVYMVQDYLYQSCFWQPTLAVVVAAIWAPRTRNAELFTALSVSMLLTLVISVFLPAIGPADALGQQPAPGPVIRALQADPTAHSLPYLGIVSFPSFHAVLAVLFAYVHRGLRWTFPFAVVLNGLMLLSVPLCGDHYLVDVLAGLCVALTSIFATRRLLRQINARQLDHRCSAAGASDGARTRDLRRDRPAL